VINTPHNPLLPESILSPDAQSLKYAIRNHMAELSVKRALKMLCKLV